MNEFVDIFVSTFTVDREWWSITRFIGLLEKFCLRYSSSFSIYAHKLENRRKQFSAATLMLI